MAIIINTYCDRCQSRCVVSEQLIEDHKVIWCRECDQFWLDGDTFKAAGDSDNVKAQLAGRLEELERHRQMQESDWSDPRWERVN